MNGPLKPQWSIIIGNYVYKKSISLHSAYKIAAHLQNEVLDIKIARHTSIKDSLRMGETG